MCLCGGICALMLLPPLWEDYVPINPLVQVGDPDPQDVAEPTPASQQILRNKGHNIIHTNWKSKSHKSRNTTFHKLGLSLPTLVNAPFNKQ